MKMLNDHSVSINFKYYDSKDFNKLNINKNSFLATLNLSIALLFKHFKDLQNFLSLLKNSFDIIGISKNKINRSAINSAFNLPGYTICLMKVKAPTEGQIVLVLTV